MQSPTGNSTGGRDCARILSAMPEPHPVVIDVRPTLAAGGDPYDEIMSASEALLPGQALVVVNSFEPFPLYDRLGARGFEHRIERLPDGDWRVIFRHTES